MVYFVFEMIKKTTIAVFKDGDYKGEYDWKGGMPLSEGEVLVVHLKNPDRSISYVLDKKTIELVDDGEDQLVKVEYNFKKNN